MTTHLARTAKGKTAFYHRQDSLPRKQRIVLMAIDQSRPRQTYLDALKNLGDVDALLDELEKAGLITSQSPPGADTGPPCPPLQQTYSPEADRLGCALSLMGGFVTDYLPEHAVEMLVELDRMDTLNDLLALLPDYRVAVALRPDVSMAHLAQVDTILTH